MGASRSIEMGKGHVSLGTDQSQLDKAKTKLQPRERRSPSRFVEANASFSDVAQRSAALIQAMRRLQGVRFA